MGKGYVKYTAEQIQHAGMMWYQYRNFRKVSRETDIPWETMKMWESEGQEHWEIGKKREASSVDKRLSVKMLKITEGAMDFLQEQLDDPEQRKGLKTRDVSLMGAIYHDKRQVLEGKPTTISGKGSVAVERRLEEIAEALDKADKRKGGSVSLFSVKK